MGKRTILTEQQIQEAISEYAGGATTTLVCEKYRLDRKTLYKFLISAGVHVRTHAEMAAITYGVHQWVKVCRECKWEKPVGEFRPAKENTDGRDSICYECLNNSRRPRDAARYKDDPEYREKVLANCKDNYVRHADYAKSYGRQYRYNITEEEYQRRLEEQGGMCAVCGATDPGCKGRSWAVDHDHTCCPGKNKTCGKCNRGILCQPCNAALGMAKDNPNTLRKLAEYLENYAATHPYQPTPDPNNAPPYGLDAPSA
jgi:hypothetical protein